MSLPSPGNKITWRKRIIRQYTERAISMLKCGRGYGSFLIYIAFLFCNVATLLLSFGRFMASAQVLRYIGTICLCPSCYRRPAVL